MIALV
ncbi:hypothetical protein YPPY59_3534, partial [Yersinia pestis PY-59]